MTNVSNNQTDTNNQSLVNTTATQTAPMINIFLKYKGQQYNIAIEPHKTISELMNKIYDKIKTTNVNVIHNANELNAADNSPLSSIFVSHGTNTLTVIDINSFVQTQTNPNTNNALRMNNYDNNLNTQQENCNVPSNNNQAQQNDTITLYCTNVSSLGLNNSEMTLYRIDVRKNLTVDQTKDEILKAEITIDNKQTNLKNFNVDKNRFVVCKADDNGRPIKILNDDEKISDVFNESFNYVIIPNVVTVRIVIDGTEQDFNYPVIINNEFNNQSLKKFIMDELANKNMTLGNNSKNVNALNDKGWEVPSGVKNCFHAIQYDDVEITTKTKTLQPMPAQVPAQTITVPQVQKVPAQTVPVQNYNDSNEHFVRGVNIWGDKNRHVLTTNVPVTAPVPQVQSAYPPVVQRPMPVPAQTHVAPVPVRVPTFFASRQQRTNNPPERYKLEKANGPIDPMRRYRMFDGYGFLYSQKPIKTWPSERGLQMWTDDPTAYYRFQ